MLFWPVFYLRSWSDCLSFTGTALNLRTGMSLMPSRLDQFVGITRVRMNSEGLLCESMSISRIQGEGRRSINNSRPMWIYGDAPCRVVSRTRGKLAAQEWRPATSPTLTTALSQKPGQHSWQQITFESLSLNIRITSSLFENSVSRILRTLNFFSWIGLLLSVARQNSHGPYQLSPLMKRNMLQSIAVTPSSWTFII